MPNWIKYLITVLVSLIIGFCIGYFTKKSKVEYIKVPIDVRDTIVVQKDSIINKTRIKYIDRIDTFYIDKDADTVYIFELPIDHKQYTDTISTDSTDAVISIAYSGFNSSIDSLSLIYNYHRENIYPVDKYRKYGLDLVMGVGVGYGYDFLRQRHSTYVGINLTLGLGLRLTK